MRGASRLYAALLIVVVACFGFGLFRLFVLRFERGDIYPPYSSLRSDPLGSKALYRSLEAIPGIRVERGFADLAKRKDLTGATVLVLGEKEDFFKTGKRELEALEGLVSAGNRLVVGFLPRTGAESAEAKGIKDRAEQKEKEQREKAQDGNAQDGKAQDGKAQDGKAQDGNAKDGNAKDGKAKDGNAKDGNAKEPGKDAGPGVSLAAKWEVSPDSFADNGKGESLREAHADRESAALPGKLSRHSRLFFKLTGSDWRTVYRSGGEPVVIERRMGNGSVVLLADSYPFSNEALRGEPDASLLAWIVGDNRSALFDEFHLGVGDAPGMGTLMRRYSMENFLGVLLVLALLYIWKNSVPFLRALPPEESGVRTSGKDNFTGLVNLLRRTVSPDKLLDTCFREWRRTFHREYREHPEKLAQVEALLKSEASLPPRRRDNESAYRRISDLLAKKRR